jgi:hypothetical protein
MALSTGSTCAYTSPFGEEKNERNAILVVYSNASIQFTQVDQSDVNITIVLRCQGTHFAVIHGHPLLTFLHHLLNVLRNIEWTKTNKFPIKTAQQITESK